jgi:replicative DNA helicase
MSDGLKLLSATVENGSISTLRKLQADYFIDNERLVYDYMRLHFRRFRELPLAGTVYTETGIRLPLAEEQHEYYLQRVIDRQLYNQVTEEFSRLRNSLKTRDMDRVRSNINTMRAIVREQSVHEDIRDLQEAGRGVISAFEEAKLNPGVTGVPSGWNEFDQATGGYQAGDLISMIGRMGEGKTYMALAQALAAWISGFSVLFVSMEMTILQISRRLIGMQAGVNPEYVRKGQLSIWAERRLRRVMRDLIGAERFHIYAGGFSKQVDDVELLIQEYNPDMVYIDGAYLLRPDTARQMGRFERVAEVMDALKKMTITQNRPIFQTSQFARSAGKKGKEGSLENIGFTDAIGTHSSIVLAIKEGRAPNQATRRLIDVLKGREGEHGRFEVRYQFAPVSFAEIPRMQQSNQGERAKISEVESETDWASNS